MRLFVALGLVLLACGPNRVQRTLVPPRDVATLDRKSSFLKAHLRTGYVYVLREWQVDSTADAVSGRGTLLTPDREVESEGEYRLPVDSVALFETNLLQRGGGITALSVMTGITAAVTAFCLAEAKACFGSCPTFYVADGAGWSLQAEGFSASIAPALEATDVDALWRARPRDRDFRLRLTNEALETHVIRHADVLAVPRARSGRVLATADGAFRSATEPRPPRRCSAPDGDCASAVRAADGRERTSPADSLDLAARETIDLEFGPEDPGEYGLVITSRQSLMTTYLLYQSLSWLGDHAAAWLASLGSAGPDARESAQALGRHLGRIEVLVADSVGEWTPVGSVGETGPLAADTKVIPLPVVNGLPLRVRLRLTRGLWRIDHVGLARLGPMVRPLRIRPARVEREARSDPAAWRTLIDSTRRLVTLPGDELELVYRLPEHPEHYELFLESRGYYLEWMRREWLAEENPLMAAQLLLDPEGALQRLAPAYKAMEPEMERVFWGSRYVRR